MAKNLATKLWVEVTSMSQNRSCPPITEELEQGIRLVGWLMSQLQLPPSNFSQPALMPSSSLKFCRSPLRHIKMHKATFHFWQRQTRIKWTCSVKPSTSVSDVMNRWQRASCIPKQVPGGQAWMMEVAWAKICIILDLWCRIREWSKCWRQGGEIRTGSDSLIKPDAERVEKRVRTCEQEEERRRWRGCEERTGDRQEGLRSWGFMPNVQSLIQSLSRAQSSVTNKRWWRHQLSVSAVVPSHT